MKRLEWNKRWKIDPTLGLVLSPFILLKGQTTLFAVPPSSPTSSVSAFLVRLLTILWNSFISVWLLKFLLAIVFPLLPCFLVICIFNWIRFVLIWSTVVLVILLLLASILYFFWAHGRSFYPLNMGFFICYSLVKKWASIIGFISFQEIWGQNAINHNPRRFIKFPGGGYGRESERKSSLEKNKSCGTFLLVIQIEVILFF